MISALFYPQPLIWEASVVISLPAILGALIILFLFSEIEIILPSPRQPSVERLNHDTSDFAGAASGLLFVSVLLLCAYEVAAVYINTGIRNSSIPTQSSGYFFGISAIVVGIDLLPLIKMVFSGPGLNVDEWVTQAYLYARTLSKVRTIKVLDP